MPLYIYTDDCDMNDKAVAQREIIWRGKGGTGIYTLPSTVQ